MKQSYRTPCAELLLLANEDIITASLNVAGGSGVGNSSSIDCSNWITVS